MDAQGHLYACGPGGVWVLSPAGERLGLLRLPEDAHNLAWGDEDARTLYVTALTERLPDPAIDPGHPPGPRGETMSKHLEPGRTLPDFDAARRVRRTSTGSRRCRATIRWCCCSAAASTARASAMHQREMIRLPPVVRGGVHAAGDRPAERRARHLQAAISTGAYWPFLCDAELEMQTALEIASTPTLTTQRPCRMRLCSRRACVIDKVYVGYWFWGRPSPEMLWSDLQDLCRRIKPDYDPLADEARAAWDAAQLAGAVNA